MVAIDCPNQHPIATAAADGTGVYTFVILPDGSIKRGMIRHKHTITCDECGAQRTWYPRRRETSRITLAQQVQQLLPSLQPALS